VKASDFFLDVVDFFAVLVPGAILVYLGLRLVNLKSLGLPEPAGELQITAAFLAVSYAAGQLIYAAGSWFLDPIYDETYKRYRQGVRGKELRRLADARMDAELKNIGAGGQAVTKRTPWTRAVLTLRGQSGWAEVERLDADAKFFRGMTIVLLVGPYAFFGRRYPFVAYSVLGLVLLLGSVLTVLAATNENFASTADAVADSGAATAGLWQYWPIIKGRWRSLPAIVLGGSALVLLAGVVRELSPAAGIVYGLVAFAFFLRFAQQRWQRNETAYELYLVLEAASARPPTT
jgi:hypothetical protein